MPDNVPDYEVVYRVVFPTYSFKAVVRKGMVIRSEGKGIGMPYQNFAQWVLHKGGTLRKINQ